MKGRGASFAYVVISTLTVHMQGVTTFRLNVPMSKLRAMPLNPAPDWSTPASVVLEALP